MKAAPRFSANCLPAREGFSGFETLVRSPLGRLGERDVVELLGRVVLEELLGLVVVRLEVLGRLLVRLELEGLLEVLDVVGRVVVEFAIEKSLLALFIENSLGEKFGE